MTFRGNSKEGCSSTRLAVATECHDHSTYSKVLNQWNNFVEFLYIFYFFHKNGYGTMRY